MLELELSGRDVLHRCRAPRPEAASAGLYRAQPPDLKERLPPPVIPPALASVPTSEDASGHLPVIDEADLLVHHPTSPSRAASRAFIDQARERSGRLAIKQHALQATSGPDSPISASLIRAASPANRWSPWSEAHRPIRRRRRTSTWGPPSSRRPASTSSTASVRPKTPPRRPWWCGAPAPGSARYCHMGTGKLQLPDGAALRGHRPALVRTELGEDLTTSLNYLTGYSRQRQYRRCWSPRSRCAAGSSSSSARRPTVTPDHHQVQTT